MNLLAALAVARVLEIPPEALREAVESSPWMPCAAGAPCTTASWSGTTVTTRIRKRRPASMIDVLSKPAPRGASRCWARCWNWGTRPGAAPPGGRIRGTARSGRPDRRPRQARLMVERRPPRSSRRRSFSRTRFKPGNSSAGWRRRETRAVQRLARVRIGTRARKVPNGGAGELLTPRDLP